MKELVTYQDLPEYGKYVLVYGVDSINEEPNFHVCEMNDLEDGLDFEEKVEFLWLTESGRKITNVTHWQKLPEKPNKQ